MAIKTVNFKRHVTFTGRNGTFKCAGVELMKCGDRIQISPITSKGDIGRCDIDIPAEDVDEFVKAMQGVATEEDKPIINLHDLCTSAEGGDKDAAAKVAELYDETPHDSYCPTRQHGAAECICIKSRMMAFVD